MSGLVIGVDARASSEDRAGRGRTTRELLAAMATLARDDELLAYVRGTPTELPHGVEARALEGRGPLWHRRVAADAEAACDVFLSTNSYLTPLFLKSPAAVLVYDLVSFSAFGLAHRRARLNERLTLRRVARRTESLICISAATRAALEERIPAARGKTAVCGLGVGAPFGAEPDVEADRAIVARHGLRKPFVLAVGTREPRKNHARLALAFERLTPHLRDSYDLVVVGAHGWGGESSGEQVRWLGWVPDDELAALYRGCTVFCYPSIAEGYGLPILEAMRCGAPVATSRRSSMPEVAGDAAAYFDPLDPGSIARTLTTLLTDDARRRELARAGIRRSRGMTWEAVAAVVLRELRHVVSDHVS